MRRFGVLLLIIGLIITTSPIYTKANIAVDFTSPTTNQTSGTWSLGWAFTVNQPLLVKALGFYDDFKNGLVESHNVGIFDASQNLVVSGQVVPGDSLLSWWRWTDVTPTVLSPGIEYQIAAVSGTENYTWDPSGFSVNPSVNYLYDTYYVTHQSSVLVYPNRSLGIDGFFGPNFSGDTVAVPVPGAVLLVIPGLMTLIGLRKKLS